MHFIIEIMKEMVSIVFRIIIIILADVYTIFARKMNLISQQTYSQTSEYIGIVVWILVLAILFGVSTKLCDLEKRSYIILMLLALLINIIYIISSIRYYGIMTLGLFVSAIYMINLIKIRKNL